MMGGDWAGEAIGSAGNDSLLTGGGEFRLIGGLFSFGASGGIVSSLIVDPWEEAAGIAFGEFVCFCSSINLVRVEPGPSPTGIEPNSFICELADAHPLPDAMRPPSATTAQATAHMAFTIPPPEPSDFACCDPNCLSSETYS